MDSDSNSDNESNENLQINTQRIFKERTIFTDPSQFRERFRVTPRLFELLQRIGQQITPSAPRNKALSASEKLLIALR
ncbi:hypothetical protein ACQ4LE_000373 [Meloidogyne hapla]